MKSFCNANEKKSFRKCQHCQSVLHTNKVEIVTDIVVMSDEVVSDKSVDG